MDQQKQLQTSDGASIAYWVHRSPRARGGLVLLHGVASNHTRWSEFLQKTSLTEHWNTLRIDLRGHAQSLFRGRITMERWCDDLNEMMHAEGSEKNIIVGHSMGANLAMHFAHRYPQRVMGLVLIDPVPAFSVRKPLLRRRALRLFFCAAVGAMLLLNRLGLYRKQLPELDLQRLDEYVRETYLKHKRYAEMEKFYSSTREDLKYLPTAAYLQDLIEIMRPLPAVPAEMPVLMLLSAGQRMADVELSRAYAKSLPDCQVIEFNANHWIMTEQPEAARAAIENWLEGLWR